MSARTSSRARTPGCLNKKHLMRAHEFYEKYGGLTIILARFIPIIRTFAPFVAGIGKMNYFRFAVYNVIGGAAWVVLFLVAGWWFGGREMVQKNFHLVIFAIIGISILPPLIEAVRVRMSRKGFRDSRPERYRGGDPMGARTGRRDSREVRGLAFPGVEGLLKVI